MIQHTCIYQSYINSLTSVSISLWTQMLFVPLQINRAQAIYSDFMGGFDYKVSQDSCHCTISLNWKMRIYYKVQVKSFQTEGMLTLLGSH